MIILVVFLVSFHALAQNVKVTGKVTDFKTGESIPGVSITYKGTTTGVATSIDGAFSLNIPLKGTLVFSFVGYATQEVAVSSNVINVQLKGASETIDEVVVIGYGKVKKGDATGAVLAIKPDNFNKGSLVTPQQALQGKMAGVNVSPGGGAPGEGATIRIRGGSSLAASNDPLIIIDGVAVDNSKIYGSSNPLSTINPNDIETFTVLKDASATAIYGSRASNGVVIITTKKGSKGAAGKPSFNYNSNFTVSHNPSYLDVLDASEYRALISKTFGANSVEFKGLGLAGTDWQKEIFRTAFGHDHNFSMTGQTKFSPYRVAIGYTNQQGTIKTNDYERVTLGLGVNPTFLDNHLSVNVNLKGSFENANNIDNPAGSAVSFDPTRPVYTPEAKYGLGYFMWTNNAGIPNSVAATNPVSMLNLRDDNSKVFRNIGSAQFDYKLHGLEDLRFNLNLGYDILKSDGKVLVPENAPSTWTGNGDGLGVKQDYTHKKNNNQLDLYASYAKEVGRHKFDVMAGYSWQHFWSSYDNLRTSATGAKVYETNFTETENYLVSFYGRMNYSLDGKYLLTATLRNDGSSRFSDSNRWGLFPSAAFAWKINQEPFLKDKHFISDLKLRLSYGQTGQQDIGGDYAWQQSYTVGKPNAAYLFGDVWLNTLRPNGFDGDLKWETTTTWNAGLDYGFFNNRLSGSVELYLRKTTDLLNRIEVAAGSNLTNMIFTNIGSMENKGVEFSVIAIPVSTNNFKWDASFNLTYNTTEITKLTAVNTPNYGIKVGSISGATGATVQVHTVGYAPNTFLLYQQNYDVNGNPIEGSYVDQNGSKSINDDDLVKQKKPSADVYCGLSSKVTYKNFDLGFNAHASFGNYVYNNVASKQYTDGYLYVNNQYANVLSSTVKTGFKGQQLKSNYFLSDGSFFRMDNITCGYSFAKLFGTSTSLRLSAAVQNVFIITGYDGLDPEIFDGIDNNLYSRPRTYMLGLNLNF